MATNQPLSLFISSKMTELADERRAVQNALSEYEMHGWLWEKDVSARPVPINSIYLTEVEACDIYIGLFWLGYGPYTIEEYEHARKHHKDCLIYEKYVDIDKRDPRLQAFLDNIQRVKSPAGLSVCRFETAKQLAKQVQRDVMRLLSTRFRQTFNSATIRTKSKGIAVGTIYEGHINQYHYGQTDDEQATKRSPTWRTVQE